MSTSAAYHGGLMNPYLYLAIVAVALAILIISENRSRRPRHYFRGNRLNAAQRRLIARDLSAAPTFRPEWASGDLRRTRRSGTQ
ncbi:MAG: hypothetical protein AAB402_04470 [Patescibacteria group bacterium]